MITILNCISYILYQLADCMVPTGNIRVEKISIICYDIPLRMYILMVSNDDIVITVDMNHFRQLHLLSDGLAVWKKKDYCIESFQNLIYLSLKPKQSCYMTSI